MKTLKESVTFTGPRFEVITVSQLRAMPGDILAQVEFGKTFLITRNGQAVAVLSQPPGDSLAIVFNADGTKSYAP